MAYKQIESFRCGTKFSCQLSSFPAMDIFKNSTQSFMVPCSNFFAAKP